MSAYQRAEFRGTTTQLARSSGALVDVRESLIKVADPASAVMYGYGGPKAAAGALAAYERLSGDISTGLTRLHEVAPATALAMVDQARRHWQAVDTDMRAAPALVASGAVEKGLKIGKDPFTGL